MEQRTQRPSLYDPRTLGRLGLLFTPAFSAYFEMKNWETLGETEKAQVQRRWLLWSVALLVANVVTYVADLSWAFGVLQVVWIVQILWWYFKPHAHHRAYIKVRLKDAFVRRSVLMPGLVTTAVLLVMVAAMAKKEYAAALKQIEDAGLTAKPFPLP